MTAEGRPYARFRRALEVRSVFQAETAARDLGRLGLNDALVVGETTHRRTDQLLATVRARGNQVTG
jgi:hypothetical protein